MKIKSSTILVLLTIICLIACSENSGENVTRNFNNIDTSNSEITIRTARVDAIIDPITIQVVLDNQKTIVKLMGLATPNLDANPNIYNFALNFTKFHLHKDKEVRIQEDQYNINEEIHLSYLFVDGEMYNKLMLSNGYAIVSNTYSQFEYKKEFQSIEQKAQDSNLGYWEISKDIINNQENKSNQFNQNKPTGTLPRINTSNSSKTKCDYTQDDIPVIKANYDKKSMNKTYYLPDSIFYKTIEIRKDDGDKLFCKEIEAQKDGWIKSKH